MRSPCGSAYDDKDGGNEANGDAEMGEEVSKETISLEARLIDIDHTDFIAENLILKDEVDNDHRASCLSLTVHSFLH